MVGWLVRWDRDGFCLGVARCMMEMYEGERKDGGVGDTTLHYMVKRGLDIPLAGS